MFQSLYDFIAEMFYSLIWLIFKVAELVERLFLAFIGIEVTGEYSKFNPIGLLFNSLLPGKYIPTPENSGGALSNTAEANSFGKDITKYFMIILAISLAIFVVAVTIKAIRNARLGQVHAKNKKLISSSVKAIVRMVIIPTLFIFAFFIATQLLGVIFKLLNDGGSSMALTSFKSCFSLTPDPNGKMSIPDSAKPDFLTNFKNLDSLDKFKSFTEVHAKLAGSESAGKYYYLSFATGNLSYLMALATGLVLCYVMFKTAVKAARRLFDIIILYFTVPFVSSLTPIDDGKAFDTWKKNTTNKLFTVFGIVFSFFIFILINKIFTNFIHDSGLSFFPKLVINLVILVANSFLLIKGENFISDYIGQGSDSSADDIQSSSSQAAPAATAAGAVGGSATMAAAKLKQGELERKLYPNGKVPGAKLKGKDNLKGGKFSAKGIGGKDPNKKSGLFSGLSGKANKLSIKSKLDNQKKKPGKPKDKFGKLESHIKRKEQHDRKFNLSELNRTKKLIAEESKKLKSQQTQAKLKNVGNKLKSAGSKTLKNVENNLQSDSGSSVSSSEE